MGNLNVNNVIKIPKGAYGGFFRAWLEYLTPLHNLSNKAKDLAASFLKERYRLSQSIPNQALVDEILMSTDSKARVKNDCGLSTSFYHLLMRDLKKAGFITDAGIVNAKYVPKCGDKKGYFNLLLLFEMNEEEG
jgi:hypothetical protein